MESKIKEDEPLYIFPTDVTYNNNYKQGRILVFGRTPADEKTGITRSVRLDFDINVYCYLKLPNEFQKEWTETLENLLSDLGCISDQVVGFKYCEKAGARIFDFGNKHKLIKVTCKSERAEEHFVNALNELDEIKLPKSGKSTTKKNKRDNDGEVSLDRFSSDGTLKKGLDEDDEKGETYLIKFPVVFFEARTTAITRCSVLYFNPGAPIKVSKWNLAKDSSHEDSRRDAHNEIQHVDLHIGSKIKYIHQLEPTHPLMTTPNRAHSTIFDIETSTLDAQLPEAQVYCISVIRHEAVTHKMSMHMYTWKNPLDSKTDGHEIKRPISMGALKNIYVSADERSMLTRFYLQELVQNKPCIIVGHNSTWFDVNYIIVRATELEIDGLENWGKTFTNSYIRKAGAKWSDQLWSSPGRLQIDTMIFYKVYGDKEDRYGLGPLSEKHLKTLRERKEIKEGGTYLPPEKHSKFQKALVELFQDDDCKTTNFLSPIKGDVHYTQMGKYFKSLNLAERQELLCYCAKDTILTTRHYVEKDMLTRLNMMARIFGVNMDTVMNAGQQDKLWVQLLVCIHKKDLVLNVWSKPHLDPFSAALLDWKYEGGYVFDPVPGAYDLPVFYLDFESLYPSIMMAFWLCLSTIRPLKTFSDEELERLDQEGYRYKRFQVEDKDEVVVIQSPDFGFCPQLQASMKKQRKDVKRLMADELDKDKIAIHSSMEKAIKVYMNGMYGIFALKNGKLFYKFLSAIITQLARDRIKESAKIALEFGKQFMLQQVYGDTDSIALWIRGDKIILEIKKQFEQDVENGVDIKIASRKKDLAMVRRTFEIAETLSDHVTKTLRQLHKTEGVDEKSEQNLANALTFAVDKVFLPFFIGARKKMYTGSEWTNDKITKKIEDYTMPESKVTGIESKKSDRCLHLRELLNTGIKLMNSGYCKLDDLMAVVHKYLDQVCENKVSIERMAIIKGLKHDTDDYKVKTEHVGVAKRKIKRGDLADTTKGSKLSYVHVLPSQKETTKFVGRNEKRLSIFDIDERELMIKKRDLCEDVPFAIEHKMEINSKYYLTNHYPTSVTAIVLLFTGQDPKMASKMKRLFAALVAKADARLNNCQEFGASLQGNTKKQKRDEQDQNIQDEIQDMVRPSKRAKLLLSRSKFNI